MANKQCCCFSGGDSLQYNIYIVNISSINLRGILLFAYLTTIHGQIVDNYIYVSAFNSFLSSQHFLFPSVSFITFLFLFVVLNAFQSFPQVSPLSLSSSPLSLWSPLFFLLSALSLLVISTCQAKGSRQMDGQMNTQICRGAKRMMERWNKGVTVRDSAQLSPVQGLGGSGGVRREEKCRQKGEKWRKRCWRRRRRDFKAISIVPYLVVKHNKPWQNDVNKCHIAFCCRLITHNSDSSFCHEGSYISCFKHPPSASILQKAICFL